MRGGFALLAFVLSASLAWAAPLHVSVQPAAVVLGNGRTVEAHLQRDSGELPLHAYAAVGKLSEIEDPLATELDLTWTPPSIRYPMTAVLLFWSQPDASDVAVVRIPLIGRTDLQVTTEPRADVRVQVEMQTFGPVRADGRGKVVVPIEVPPGVTQAKVLASVSGNQSTRTVPLEVPKVNPLAATLSSDPISSKDGGTLIIAHAESMKGASLDVDPSGGTLEKQDENDERALYHVTPDKGANAFVVRVALKGDPRTQILAQANVTETPIEPPAASGYRALAFAEVGGFYGGGSNFGPAVFIGAGLPMPSLHPKLSFGAELGFRHATLTSNVAGLGRLTSNLSSLPFDLFARFALVKHGGYSVAVRGGLGVLFFDHGLSSNYQPSFTEAGFAPAAFVAVSAGYELGDITPFVDLRGDWGGIHSSHVSAQLGGVSVMIGVRYGFR